LGNLRITPGVLRSLRKKLLRWYHRSKRDLPWRSSRDPYAVWISEIMLQQTRVAAVLPYYERFLRRFPDVAALANAPETELLALWSGLGYYSRARNLQKAALQIMELGEFPRSYESIAKLAGIGPYTAAAVASIAFGLPHAAVDGNVRRVMSRMANNPNVKVQEWADALLDPRDPGAWNQAVMELGATICLPRKPLCGACPIAEHCAARRDGAQDRIPGRPVKRPLERIERTLLVIRVSGRLLLTPGARVPGFWDLPEPFPGAQVGIALGQFSHTITHRHYRFSVCEAKARAVPRQAQWFTDKQLETIPLSTTARKALRIFKAAETGIN
jgi:A/G-specific adenine glycosylase